MVKTALNYLLILIIVVVGSLLLAGAVLLYSHPLCTQETLQEVSSPNGREKAVVYRSDCGATTDFETRVELMGATIFRSKSADPVKVEWEGTNVLRLTYFGCKTYVIKSASEQGNVHIETTVLTETALKESGACEL